MHECLSVEADTHEILEVNHPIAIEVALLDQVVPVHLLVIQELLPECRVLDGLEVLYGESSSLILVQAEEFLLKFLQFVVGGIQPGYQGEHDSLESGEFLVVYEVLADTVLDFSIFAVHDID